MQQLKVDAVTAGTALVIKILRTIARVNLSCNVLTAVGTHNCPIGKLFHNNLRRLYIASSKLILAEDRTFAYLECKAWLAMKIGTDIFRYQYHKELIVNTVI